MMSSKKVGTIKTTPQKVIGCFYRPSASQEARPLSNIPKNSLKGSRINPNSISAKKRSNSVGKIYINHLSERRTSVDKQGSDRKEYHCLINYEEMQNKLSTYLTCTMRTANRQKYNYLSQHSDSSYRQKEPYNKLKYCETQIKPRKTILMLAEDINRNNLQACCPNAKGSFKCEQKFARSAFKKVEDKENIQKSLKEKEQKKENVRGLLNVNHREQKEELSKKLMKIIDSYENKNKELSFEMKKIETKFESAPAQAIQQKVLIQTQPQAIKQVPTIEQSPYSEDILNESFSKLIQNNQKSICLSGQCDQKLDQLWKYFHQQIILDEKLRIIKSFTNEENMSLILEEVNRKKMKKLDLNVFKKNAEEYDPFLIQKIGGIIDTTNFTNKATLSWISDTFIKCYDESERHWVKYLSQEKIECSIRSMLMEKQVTGLRQKEGTIKDLNLRDFTRWMSIIFKANLRNRNVYQIFNKLKDMSYVGRFIEILEEKAGKGAELKKFTSSK